MKLGRFERSVYPLTKCCEMMPKNEKYFVERAKAFQALQMFDEAVADYTHVLSLNKTHTQALFRRAFAYKAQSKFELAIADFDRARALDPDNAHFNVNYRHLRNVNYLRTS